MNLSDLIDDPEFHELDAVERAHEVRIRLRGCLYDHDVIALLCQMLYVERTARRTKNEGISCLPFSNDCAGPGGPSVQRTEIRGQKSENPAGLSACPC